MVTGRAHRDKGVPRLSADNGIHSGGTPAQRAQGRLQRTGRDMGVGVQRDIALVRNRGLDPLQVAFGMAPQDLGPVCQRRLSPVQPIDLSKRRPYGLGAGDALGMARRRHVGKRGFMGKDKGHVLCSQNRRGKAR